MRGEAAVDGMIGSQPAPPADTVRVRPKFVWGG
jgi:hypothetical protein